MLGIVFLIVVCVLIFDNIKMWNRKKELVAEIKEYQNQIEEIQKSSQTLKEEIQNADDKDYLEKVAYEQLNQQKPGEKVITFIEPQNPQKDDKAIEGAQKKSWSSWLSGLWQAIKDKF